MPTKATKGFSALIVERGMDGFEVGAKEDKLGIRGSDTHTLMFTDVKVPKANRIGEDGFGFKFAMKTLSGGRIGIAAQALGIAAGAYELALAYSRREKLLARRFTSTKLLDSSLQIWQLRLSALDFLYTKQLLLRMQAKTTTLLQAWLSFYASEVAMKQLLKQSKSTEDTDSLKNTTLSV